jgi:hypothetical protein
MTDHKACMDLFGMLSEYAPQRRSCDDNSSRLDFSLCMEEDIYDISNDTLVQYESMKPEHRKGGIHANIQMECRLHASKPNPRVIYNICIGRITDLESRNLLPLD